jgi:tetraacyldisaccharide 4'-kinase
MRAPAFWQHDGLTSRLLAPLAWMYDGIGRLRRHLVAPERAAVPVVCVGNLVAGGAGKTPTALAIARLLMARGHAVHFLSRGHGGRLSGPVRVDPKRHTAADVGDEPLLLSRLAPAWVARNRAAGARAAVAAGAEIIVMDDGLQNPGLLKDLSLVVIDAAQGLGNGRVHPAGPLREDAVRGLGRADAVILIDIGEPARTLPAGLPELPRLTARLVPTLAAQQMTGRRVFAFAGIGRPERFFHTLRDLGAKLAGSEAFGDHHPYTPEEVMALIERAHALDATPVTTAKDFMRLPAEARAMVEVIEVELEFANPDAMARLLARVAPALPMEETSDG